MKKQLLSVSLIVVFAIYAITKRFTDANMVVVTPPTNTPSSTPSTTTGQYHDGQYTGTLADAYYGYVQVKTTIQQGKITDVAFLSYPNDRNHSIQINSYAMPILKSEAIQTQTAQVDTVTGASATSGAFRESLSSALSQAKN